MKVGIKRDDENYYRIQTDDGQTVIGTAYELKDAQLFSMAPELLALLEKVKSLRNRNTLELFLEMDELVDRANGIIWPK